MVAAPLSEGELLARCDLAGWARVVTCENGFARLRFTRLLKGRPRGTGLRHRLGLGRTATIALRGVPQPMLPGDWTDWSAYAPGSRVLTHLAWDRRLGAYRTIWWNAVRRLA